MPTNHFEDWRIRVGSEDARYETMSSYVILPAGTEYDATAQYMSVTTGMGVKLGSLMKVLVVLSREMILERHGRVSDTLDQVTIDVIGALRHGVIERLT